MQQQGSRQVLHGAAWGRATAEQQASQLPGACRQVSFAQEGAQREASQLSGAVQQRNSRQVRGKSASGWGERSGRQVSFLGQCNSGAAGKSAWGVGGTRKADLPAAPKDLPPAVARKTDSPAAQEADSPPTIALAS